MAPFKWRQWSIKVSHIASYALPVLDIYYFSGKKDIFYYDLGGTFCMCEWKWDVSAYWSKVKPSNFSLIFKYKLHNIKNACLYTKKQSYSSQSIKL